jgi:NAD(P)-dependent dehydrogenase (short-subunit alcohol dehydrogenase family)
MVNPRDLDWQYRVNVRPPYLLTQPLLPEIKRSKAQIVVLPVRARKALIVAPSNSGRSCDAKPCG